MDLSGMPMQPETNGVPHTGQTPGPQQPAQVTSKNVYEQDVYMSVSTPQRTTTLDMIADSNKGDPKTSSGEGYAMGFLLPKQPQ